MPGIEGVDTRMLTRRVRDHGEQRVLMTRDLDSDEAALVERVQKAPRVAEVDHVLQVTTDQQHSWTKA